jgi:radical SAM protein with 4Fe4S-binding SPASM domain
MSHIRVAVQELVLPMSTSSSPVRHQQIIYHFWDEASVTPLGELHLKGWAVCPIGIATIAVYLDGKCLGEATLGLPRPDVGAEFKAIPMARFAGFQFHQSVPGIAAGDHEVRLVIRNLQGEERSEIKRLHTVNAAPPAVVDPHPSNIETSEFLFQVDSPRVVHGAAAEPVIERLTIEGWVLSRSGVAGIEVRLDDILLGEAQYGLARPDVDIAYPAWDSALHSGYKFHFPPSALHEGRHLVELIVRSRNGQALVEHFRIDVRTSENADILVGIGQDPGDSPSRFQQLLPTLLPTLVDQIYRTVLCRPADTDGLSHYVNLLTTGKINLRGLVDAVYERPEYLMVIGPAIEEVRAAYRLLFEREPTQAEIYNHMQAFRATCSSDDEAISLFRTGGAARTRLAIRPLKIEMDITNQCNIRCVMCSFSDPIIGSRKRKDVSKETFLRWADEMFSWATQVGLLFGAEPTLNPNLLSFVRIAKEFRVPNVYFSTNAMKLTPALTGDLIEAGLDEINVSLDAGKKMTFERIRRGAKWDTVVGNLKSLRDQKVTRGLSRPRLHLSFVMMRSNVQELPQFIELAGELGAEVVYFSHLVAFDKLKMAHESLGANLDDYKQYVDRALLLARQSGIHVVLPRTRQPRINFTPPREATQEQQANHLAHVDQARESHGLPKRFARDEANSCCPFPWHFIGIDPDGSVFPCGWWHSGPPMGNLHTQRFQEIWSGEPMRSLRSQLVSRHLGTNCSRCPAAGMGSSDSSEAFQSR